MIAHGTDGRIRSILAAASPGGAPSVQDVDEVRRMGSRHGGARNADQTAAAIFWSGNPLVPWVEVARVLTGRLRGEEALAAHAMSSVAAAIGDAVTLSRQQASTHWAPLPVDVIHGSALPANSKRRPDPLWEPLLASHAASEFPCEGCVASGAAVAVLRAVLQSDAARLSVTAPWEGGLVREFETLSQMLQESEDARVWAGLNFRSTAVASTELGLRLGEEVARGR